MNNNLKSIVEFCPICGKEHNLIEVEKVSKIIFKGKNIEYNKKSYFCEKKNAYFEDEMQGESNLIALVDGYRKEVQLLTSKEIKEIREKYSLSQKDLAIILGMGEVTITRYETGVIQEKANNELLLQAKNNPQFVWAQVEKNKDKFNKKKLEKLRKTSSIYLVDNNSNLLSIIESSYQMTDEEYRGNTIFNYKKILGILKRFLEKNIVLTKVKTAKLLWYSDMLHFKNYNKGITGIVYSHMPYGALPYSFNQILELKEIEKNTEIVDDCEKTHIISVNIEDGILSEEERNVVDEICDRFKDFSSKEISEYMHQEIAYQETKDNMPISYQFAFQLRDF